VAATLTDPLLGHLVDGRYDVLSRIARGGMATVYLAIDRRLDREVALKVMHPHLAEGTTGSEFVARFRREARAAARLTHPGLVAVLDQGVDGENSYLAMEYVDGTNLRHRLQDDAAFTVEEALRTAESVLAALAVAHRAGLVHRDIKPENVLLSSEGRVKVADFGLARAVTEVSATATGTVFGTVAYLAPELVAHGVSDARTDVYAVGILLYEMLTTRQPFTGTTPIQVAYQHVHTDIPSPSDEIGWLPTEVDELVEALAARDPADRPIDAGTALQLVWRTRTELPAGVLSRNVKDRPPGHAIRLKDDDAPRPRIVGGNGTLADDVTESIVLPHPDAAPGADALRRTIALKIGSGLDPVVAAEIEPPSATRRRRLLLALAALAVALATGIWWFMTSGPGAYTTVPGGLVGAERATAEAVLDDVGLEFSTVEVFHPTVAEGVVTAVSPAEGESARKDGTVQISVSKGPDFRDIPAELVDFPADTVIAALLDAGFVVPEPLTANHDTIVTGNVISVIDPDGNPLEPGGRLPVDTEVIVTVSDGPAPLVVTSVVGFERQAAIVKLEQDQGLVVTVTEAYDEQVPAGIVISQDPAAGVESHRMAPINITVSLGPPPVDVPNVIDKRLSQARNTLEEAGFVVDVKYSGFWTRVGDPRVVEQVPAEGQAPKGSVVTITVA
jgi:serine/threonine-protein kinase